MPVVMFTLYQRDTTEGLARHFHSLVHVLLDHKALLTVWKMPVSSNGMADYLNWGQHHSAGYIVSSSFFGKFNTNLFYFYI